MLEGEIDWEYQCGIAANAVRRLHGVKEVNNQIKLRPKVVPKEVISRTSRLFTGARKLTLAVSVKVNGSNVVLKGIVRSWLERDEAQRAAWAAPGVTNVVNRISLT